MSRRQKPTLKDVAKAAGTSQSTASRALAGNPAISPETISRVQAAAKSLSYAPKRRDKSERPGRQKGVVGIVVAALHNAFYPFLIDRMHDELDMLGYDMILFIDEFSNSSTSRKFQSLIDTSLDGVIFTTAIIDSPSVELLVERRIPTVLAIRSNQRGNVSVVESDNIMAGQEAAQHLLELGHERIGFILGPRNTSTASDRFNGFCAELQRSDVAVDNNLVIWSDFNHESGYSGLIRLMQQPTKPTAVFCANDVVAIGALDAARKIGLQVPEDVSIIGVDDIPMASWSMISLTSVRQPIEQIANQATRRIVSQIEKSGPITPTHDILPTSIVRRETTGAPPVNRG